MAKKRSTVPEFDVGARLREIRKSHHLSQRDLAERARVPHGQVAMIERNHSSPSVASLRKILSGIPMTLSEFFEPDTAARALDQVFFTPRELVDLTSRLSPRHGGTAAALLSLRQVGDARGHNLQILHEVCEGGVVISGEIEITVDGEVRVLKAGDAYLFNSRKPHRFRNVGDRSAVVVSACTPPYL
jgi:transcriptional regulator with XRE-family HTH domain